MFTSVRVAAISLKPKKWDKDHNADKLEQYFREAASQSPELILATEGMLDGYGVMEVLEGQRTAADMLAVSEPIDGPYIQRFQRLAEELRMCLCFGFAERIGDDIYNAAIFVDADGEIRGKYHKTQFAEGTHPSCNFNRIGDARCGPSTPPSAGPVSSFATTAGTR